MATNKRVRLSDDWIKIIEDCKQAGVTPNSVRVSAKGEISYSFKPSPIDDVITNIDDLLSDAIKKYGSIKKIKTPKPKKSNGLTVMAYTDTHGGMETDDSMFGSEGEVWDSKELEKRRKILISRCPTDNNDIHLLDLGDLADGLNGQTSRGGHKLPQNMSNCEAFDTLVGFKVKLVDDIKQLNPNARIFVKSVCDDNHSYELGYMINSAAKLIIESKYDKSVTVINQTKFIDHHIYGNHVFITLHGKDSRHKKFGFGVHLKPKEISQLDEYLKIHGLMGKGYDITVIKGDSHQLLLDYSSSDDYDYFNLHAFSPSSEWVRMNFKRGRSGFIRFDINDVIKTVTPYFFNQLLKP